LPTEIQKSKKEMRKFNKKIKKIQEKEKEILKIKQFKDKEIQEKDKEIQEKDKEIQEKDKEIEKGIFTHQAQIQQLTSGYKVLIKAISPFLLNDPVQIEKLNKNNQILEQVRSITKEAITSTTHNKDKFKIPLTNLTVQKQNEIGRASYGVVYTGTLRVSSAGNRTLVAVKVLHDFLKQSDAAVKSFENEVYLACKVS